MAAAREAASRRCAKWWRSSRPHRTAPRGALGPRRAERWSRARRRRASTAADQARERQQPLEAARGRARGPLAVLTPRLLHARARGPQCAGAGAAALPAVAAIALGMRGRGAEREQQGSEPTTNSSRRDHSATQSAGRRPRPLIRDPGCPVVESLRRVDGDADHNDGRAQKTNSRRRRQFLATAAASTSNAAIGDHDQPIPCADRGSARLHRRRPRARGDAVRNRARPSRRRGSRRTASRETPRRREGPRRPPARAGVTTRAARRRSERPARRPSADCDSPGASTRRRRAPRPSARADRIRVTSTTIARVVCDLERRPHDCRDTLRRRFSGRRARFGDFSRSPEGRPRRLLRFLSGIRPPGRLRGPLLYSSVARAPGPTRRASW